MVNRFDQHKISIDANKIRQEAEAQKLLIQQNELERSKKEREDAIALISDLNKNIKNTTKKHRKYKTLVEVMIGEPEFLYDFERKFLRIYIYNHLKMKVCLEQRIFT